MLSQINEALLSTEPKLFLMFSKVTSYSADKIPGYISVPALNFTVKDLCEFIKVQENINKARDFAKKYIEQHKNYEKAHDEIQNLIPKIKIARKNEKDYDLEKFSLAILRLKKFLTTEDKFDKISIFNEMIENSFSK